MEYLLSYQKNHHHYLDIAFTFETQGEEQIEVQLPAWRPGRYQLGNFAKNIQKWKVQDENGKLLENRKLTKDLWEVKCKGNKSVTIEYNYFANELNAGSTFLSDEQLYVNPVNCLLYLPSRPDENCELRLNVPKEYEVAIALEAIKKHVFQCENFDELADSPFIASASMKKFHYQLDGVDFYLWFQGLFKGDTTQLLKDFKAFSKEQGKLFGGFPFKSYHFLFQILPYKVYHGVEHANSTVIALGPTYDLLKKDKLYDELLGVSSHELFHAWNIKRIRPLEMWPYDLSKENYSRLGYLAEGATTWYGDLMLYRSAAFKEDSFLKTFAQLLNRHYNNPGSNNLSVADSSFDTWLDGYEKGVPNRKSSIYTEGALITFMLDVEIRKGSNGEYSFDDVMKTFFTDFYLQGKGISESNYQTTVEHFAGKKLSGFFNDHVNGTKDISPKLKSALTYFGYEMKLTAREDFHESYLGLVCDPDQEVIAIFPESPAENANLRVGDKIISVGNQMIDQDLSAWCEYFSDQSFEIAVKRIDGILETLSVEKPDPKKLYFGNYEIVAASKLYARQKQNRKQWEKS